MGSKIAGVVFLFFTVWGMASVIELQYWRNADTYPVWLTKISGSLPKITKRA